MAALSSYVVCIFMSQGKMWGTIINSCPLVSNYNIHTLSLSNHSKLTQPPDMPLLNHSNPHMHVWKSRNRAIGSSCKINTLALQALGCIALHPLLHFIYRYIGTPQIYSLQVNKKIPMNFKNKASARYQPNPYTILSTTVFI